MSTKLREMAVGQTATVTGYEGGRSGYRARLLAMGLTKGTKIKLLKLAPLGDPVEVELRGFSLSLRKAEADVLIVEPTRENSEVST